MNIGCIAEIANENTYAQQGKYFPLVAANFNPSRQQQAGIIAPTLTTNSSLFNLYTAQVAVTYTFDIWGQYRRAVKSLQAMAVSQRFQVEAAYLTLTANVVVAAIQEAALRGQIEATNRLIDFNSKERRGQHLSLQLQHQNFSDQIAGTLSQITVGTSNLKETNAILMKSGASALTRTSSGTTIAPATSTRAW